MTENLREMLRETDGESNEVKSRLERKSDDGDRHPGATREPGGNKIAILRG